MPASSYFFLNSTQEFQAHPGAGWIAAIQMVPMLYKGFSCLWRTILQLLRGIAKAVFLKYAHTQSLTPFLSLWWQEQQQASIWESGKDPGHAVITWQFNIHLFCQRLRVANPKYFQVWHLFYYSIPNHSVAQFLPAYALYTLFKTLRWLSFGVKQILAPFALLERGVLQYCEQIFTFYESG